MAETDTIDPQMAAWDWQRQDSNGANGVSLRTDSPANTDITCTPMKDSDTLSMQSVSYDDFNDGRLAVEATHLGENSDAYVKLDIRSKCVKNY